MSVSDDFLSYVLEQLEGVTRIRTKRMFGAVGLYGDEVFFAIVDDDVLYFKADEQTSRDYIERGMRRFMPDPSKPESTMGYFEVPPDVLEDREELSIWSRKAVQVGVRKVARPKRTGSRAKPRISRPKRKAPRKRN